MSRDYQLRQELRELKRRVDWAIAASEHGKATDAIQDMLAILTGDGDKLPPAVQAIKPSGSVAPDYRFEVTLDGMERVERSNLRHDLEALTMATRFLVEALPRCSMYGGCVRLATRAFDRVPYCAEHCNGPELPYVEALRRVARLIDYEVEP